MDRRAVFFLVAAIVSTVLIPVTEPSERWVPIVVAIVYVLLALASWADRVSRRAENRRLATPTTREDRSVTS